MECPNRIFELKILFFEFFSDTSMRRSQMTEFKKAMKSEDFEIKTKICKKKKHHKKEAPWVFVQTKKIALKRQKNVSDFVLFT